MKEGKKLIEIDKWSMEVINEKSYSINSVDNIRSYDKLYFGDDCDKHNAIEYIGIRCTVTGTNALLIASGSPKGLSEKSFLVSDDNIYVCVGNSVFCINLINLELKWTVIADFSCCFRVFELNDNLLIHGELKLTSIDKLGKKIWEFSGRDIFVSPDGADEVIIADKIITVTDWNHDKYCLDYTGRQI